MTSDTSKARYNGNQLNDGRSSNPFSLAAVPPQASAAERSVLGTILLGGNTALEAVDGILRPGDFYLQLHAAIFEAMLALRNVGDPVDAVTVLEAVRSSGFHVTDDELESELIQALESVPHECHGASYAKAVVSAARRREAICAASDLKRAALDPGTDIEHAINDTDSRLLSILDRSAGGDAVPAAEVAAEFLSKLAAPSVRGLATGYHDLDKLVGGLKPGALVILAARPGVGKTALAGNLCLNVARAGTGVLFVSLEQQRDELFERFVCTLARVDSETLAMPNKTEAVCDSIVQSANEVASMPVFIDDAAPRTFAQIGATARVHRRRKSVGLMIVDYLQIVTPEDRRLPREQAVAEIARGLKFLARNLSIPVICLAQLSRAVELRDSKRPRLSDLRESGAIEQDGDIVIFLDRPATYDANASPAEAVLIVAKNRNGKTGDVKLDWHGPSMTFRNAAHCFQRLDIPLGF